jgi:hypothetical protein
MAGTQPKNGHTTIQNSLSVYLKFYISHAIDCARYWIRWNIVCPRNTPDVASEAGDYVITYDF